MVMCQKTDEKGFTLFEMTIALIVISLLALPFIQQYRNSVFNRGYIVTNDRIAQLESAVVKYYKANGFYPCPDRKSLAVTDPAFGSVQDTGAADSDCIRPAETGPGVTVLAGAVPIQVLNLDSSFAMDGWGNKFTYVVSKNMIQGEFDRLAGDAPQGQITHRYVSDDDSPNRPSADILSNDSDITTVSLPDVLDNHVAIISHGPTGAGAENRYGNVSVACPNDGQSHDKENCDADFELLYSNTAFLDSSNQLGPDFYDDVVRVFSAETSPAWGYMQANEEDAYSHYGVIGINTDNPMDGLIGGSGEKRPGMDVDGDITVENTADTDRDGKVYSDTFCDETGSATSSGSDFCFNAQTVAGAGINCTSNRKAMKGIAHNSAVCFNYVPFSVGACPTGQYIVEIYADGSTRCWEP